jgi:hypothetical protein
VVRIADCKISEKRGCDCIPTALFISPVHIHSTGCVVLRTLREYNPFAVDTQFFNVDMLRSGKIVVVFKLFLFLAQKTSALT